MEKGKPLNGLTPDRRFFLGYALAWLGERRPESLEHQQIMSDVHAPQALRVNGPLANVPEFLGAFGVKPGEPMFRPEKLLHPRSASSITVAIPPRRVAEML